MKCIKTAAPAVGLVLVVAALAVGCAQSILGSTTSRPPRELVSAKCSACHPVPRQQSLSDPQLDRLLVKHRRRVRLTDEERAAVRQYLVKREDGRALREQ